MYKAMTETPYNVRIDKPACYHAFRYSLATHLLKVGYDISTIEELPGHKDISTTMIYIRPNKWYLDKDWRATDIVDFLGREVSEMKGIYRDLIVAPSAVHLIGRRNDHCVLELRRGVPQ